MVEGTGTVRPRVLRDGGRPCGCDPKIDHICAGHGEFVDESESEFLAYEFKPESGLVKHPLVVVLSGPDRDGEIALLAAENVYLTRFEAEDLANEILRRLAERK